MSEKPLKLLPMQVIFPPHLGITDIQTDYNLLAWYSEAHRYESNQSFRCASE